jgi:hypothetical protein
MIHSSLFGAADVHECCCYGDCDDDHYDPYDENYHDDYYDYDGTDEQYSCCCCCC